VLELSRHVAALPTAKSVEFSVSWNDYEPGSAYAVHVSSYHLIDGLTLLLLACRGRWAESLIGTVHASVRLGTHWGKNDVALRTTAS